MISLSNISYYIGERPLYEDASMFIKPQDKIGLIGLNGTGKSTLLKIINGEYQPDKGSVSKAKDCSIGFLNQDLLSYETDKSIVSVAMEAFTEAVDTQNQIEAVLHKLEHEYSDKLVNQLTALQEKFEHLNGYTLQAKAEEVLEGIGFSTQDLSRSLREFSGGWRMRVMLAKLLLEAPALLMLDEPTNHLDLPSVEWVEGYLRNYPGAVIVVSHDRYFLDNVTTKTIEISQLQLNGYKGNYSFYLQEKKLRDTIQQSAYENQQKSIRHAERFIERFRAKSTKARQVQSRIKALDRMSKVNEVTQDTAAVNFKFTFNKSSGKQVLTLNQISKSYDTLAVLHDTDALIERGDKIALIGANGKGKSTLLRILAGTEPIQGTRTIGHNVIKGFYAQHQLEALHLENQMLEELKQAGSGKTEQELRNVLGCFLFTDEDVFKKIKVLSGGEKSRVALAKTLVSEANFLLLDEPTNHLDFMSENILIQALKQYQGSFVVVSHNRHLIQQVANKIWRIEDQKIKTYPGTYEEYEYKKSTEALKNEFSVQKKKKPKQKKTKPGSSSDTANKTLKKLYHELTRLEEKNEKLEAEKLEAEKKIVKPEVYGNKEKLTAAKQQLDILATEIKKTTQLWESLVAEIDELEASPPIRIHKQP